MFQHVSVDFTFDTLFMIIAWNTLGTGLQFLFNYIHEKYKWVWSDRALTIVNFLMSMTAILIANKAHPIGRSETGPDKSKV